MTTWEFATAGRILFGAGTRREIPAAVRGLGRQALLVTGRHGARDEALRDALVEAGCEVTTFIIEGEPTLDTARAGVGAYRSGSCDVVIGLGGGSALDAAKAIAALAPNSGEPLDYLEVIGRGQPLEHTPAPCVAVPTTAGTGAEVTRNAVLGSPEHQVKASLRHPAMLPRVAIVDPELTLTLPRAVTASTGMDALTQVIEPYVSSRATPFTDALCLEGIERVARSLSVAATPSEAPSVEAQARADMALASLFGGLALANAGLGVIHGFAAPIGGMFPAPHGAVCAALLPHGMDANLRALRGRGGDDHPAIERYRRVAVALTGNPAATPESGIAAVAALCADLDIRGLRSYGISASHVAELSARAQRASSMKANPIALRDEELQALLLAAL